MAYKAAIFDLDGTLVDTLADLGDAMNFGLKKLGQQSRSLNECRMMIGSGVKRFAQRALPDNKQHLTDDLLREMRARYRQNYLNRTRLYDGIAELIEELVARGIGLAVCTNKDQGVARRIIEHFFGESVFGLVVGARDGYPIKPHRQITEAIIDFFEASRDEVVFIGDSDVDIATAVNGEMPFIGVSWGFRSRAELTAGGAEIIVDSPAELSKLIS